MASKGKARRGRQCAALPFARQDGELRVMLVTSRETRRWVLPKGWMEKRLAPHAQAAREAFEEAGIVGEVERRPIGRYEYLKRGPRDRVTPCSVRVFPLRVERLLDEWPERRQRQRRWFSPAEAALAVEEGGLVTLLLELALPDAGAAAGRPGSEGRNALEAGGQSGPHPAPGDVGEVRQPPGLVLEEAGAEDLRRDVDHRSEQRENRDVPRDAPRGARGGLGGALPHRPHVRSGRDA